MPDCQTCIQAQAVASLTAQVESIKRELETVKANKEAAHRELYGRMRDLEMTLPRIEERCANISEQISGMKADQAQIIESLNELKSQPGKRWNDAIKELVSAVIGGVVALLFAYITKGGTPQ